MEQTTKKPNPPLILGIVTASMLGAGRYPETLWSCGGAELRADGIPDADIPAAVENFVAEKRRRKFSGPTVLTLRLKRDGGAWEDSRSGSRGVVWKAVARAQLRPDFFDFEIEAVPELGPDIWSAAKKANIGVLLSHHAFTPENPEVWDQKLASMRSLKPEAVKFAVWPPDRKSVEALIHFARRVSSEFPFSCVLGMGKEGRPTRLAGPLLGCPIAYAFLEAGPVAPGQIPAETMRRVFARPGTVPGAKKSDAAWLEWAEERLVEIDAA